MSRQASAKWLAAAAAVEVGTGLVLVVRPSLFVRLIFDAMLSDAGLALGRLAGFSLLALAWACWPRTARKGDLGVASAALLGFSLLTAIYLVYVGFANKLSGPLLWPAAALHIAVAILLTLSWLSCR